MTDQELTAEWVDITRVHPHPDNPRRGNVAMIKESLEVNGQYKPIVASTATGNILAGNHTWEAARDLGWATISVVWLDGLTMEQERRIMVVDNRASDTATNDDAQLAALLSSLAALDGTGFTDDDLEMLRFLVGEEHIEPLSNPDTDAHYSGTDEEREEREESIKNYQNLKAQGLAEIILVLPDSKKTQLLEWLQTLRGRWGIEQTNGELVYGAVGRAVDQTNVAQ